MRIAIIGYGKMGREVERQALLRGHEVVARLDQGERERLSCQETYNGAEVAIEFTTPVAAVDNYLRCFAAGVPVVSGTTGWTDRFEEVKRACKETGGAFFWASNFSIGVAILTHINKRLAEVMSAYPEYRPSMLEIHHVHKLDYPSGTAKTLADDLASTLGISEINTHLGEPNPPLDPNRKSLDIVALRSGEEPGTHVIRYTSEEDTIELTHRAHGRQGFAKGAIVAAEFLKNRKGVYGIHDLLSF